MRLYVFVVLNLLWFSSLQGHPKFTFDEFFNATSFRDISLSPNGKHLLVYTMQPAWDSDCYEHSLWLHDTSGQRKRLINSQMSDFSLIKWSPSGDWIVYAISEKVNVSSTSSQRYNPRSLSAESKNVQQLHFYNVKSNEILSVEIGKQRPLALTWSNNDSSLYFAVSKTSSLEDIAAEKLYEVEWKDVIVYRKPKSTDGTDIKRIDITKKRRKVSFIISPITQVKFMISDLVYVSSVNKLVGASVTPVVEDVSALELHSIDLNDPTNITQLTNNRGLEQNLKVSSDGKSVFYLQFTMKGEEKFDLPQTRLYSVDVTSGKIELWGKGFHGSVREYSIKPDGGVYILGQLGTNVHVYVQQTPTKYSVLQSGWNGTYRKISSATLEKSSAIALLYSSFDHPEEVYIAASVNEITSAKVVTEVHQLFTQRDLPQATTYQWINPDDHRTIEGILHYPPGKFGEKNLPLLVLIHGGPTDASLNTFIPDWYTWAALAATEGWLVLEPNYRGSTGYGDEFIQEIVTQILSVPGKDILAGVDSLVENGIADPSRLTIGGYSYGGYLTNWLITQTTRFNAALSGAGPVEHVSMWGTTDLPILFPTIVGGYPWEVPEIYNKESIVFKLDKVVTPTLIYTGAEDIRVPIDQSFILERSLNYLEVPVNLILFPNEGHEMSVNPWHGRIKVREELKWLERFGHICAAKEKHY